MAAASGDELYGQFAPPPLERRPPPRSFATAQCQLTMDAPACRCGFHANTDPALLGPAHRRLLPFMLLSHLLRRPASDPPTSAD